jgi:hypothetical protein
MNGNGKGDQGFGLRGKWGLDSSFLTGRGSQCHLQLLGLAPQAQAELVNDAGFLSSDLALRPGDPLDPAQGHFPNKTLTQNPKFGVPRP